MALLEETLEEAKKFWRRQQLASTSILNNKHLSQLKLHKEHKMSLTNRLEMELIEKVSMLPTNQ